VLGNGQVVLILDLTELLSARTRLIANLTSNASALTQVEAALAPQAPQIPHTPPLANKTRLEGSPMQQTGGFAKLPTSATKTERGKHVLVVDDSPRAISWVEQVGARAVLVGKVSQSETRVSFQIGSLVELPGVIQRL